MLSDGSGTFALGVLFGSSHKVQIEENDGFIRGLPIIAKHGKVLLQQPKQCSLSKTAPFVSIIIIFCFAWRPSYLNLSPE
jgi:hypothetical protein